LRADRIPIVSAKAIIELFTLSMISRVSSTLLRWAIEEMSIDNWTF